MWYVKDADPPVEQATRQHDLFTTEPHASDHDQSLIFMVLLSTDADVVDSFARLVLNMKSHSTRCIGFDSIWFPNSIPTCYPVVQ